MTEEEADSLRERLQKVAQELFEFGDAVVVLVSYDDSDNSITRTFHANRGSAHTVDGLLLAYRQHRLSEMVTTHVRLAEDEDGDAG
jgi:hypothetical protein